MNYTALWIVVAIGRLAFFGIVRAAKYKYENALICFTMIFIGVAYGLLLACYWR